MSTWARRAAGRHPAIDIFCESAVREPELHTLLLSGPLARGPVQTETDALSIGVTIALAAAARKSLAGRRRAARGKVPCGRVAVAGVDIFCCIRADALAANEATGSTLFSRNGIQFRNPRLDS